MLPFKLRHTMNFKRLETRRIKSQALQNMVYDELIRAVLARIEGSSVGDK
jgi:hypothetical protein